MNDPERIPYPFKIIPLEDNVQKKIAKDFAGHPNGLISCNHWGLKLAATTTDQELEDLYNYPLDPRDVWVVTPPKCGTTWTQEMVWLLANDLDYEGAKTPILPVRWTFIDYAAMCDKDYMKARAETAAKEPQAAAATAGGAGAEGEQKRPGFGPMGGIPAPPRFVKSHLPMSMNNPRLLDTCKVVYVARNPKDACVSFYHHMRLMRTRDFLGDLELFMEYFMAGEVLEAPFIEHMVEANVLLRALVFQLFMEYFMAGRVVEAPFIEHMVEAWNLRHHPNMCFLFFEDMKRDLRGQLRQVAAFLGKSYTDAQIDTLAEHLHIDNFKNNPWVNMDHMKDGVVMHKDRGNFIRKGKAGDWKNHFTTEMTERFDTWMKQKMRGTDLVFVQELDKQD